MCVILPPKEDMERTFAGCELDAQVWRQTAEKTRCRNSRRYLLAAAATVEHLAKYLRIKVNQERR